MSIDISKEQILPFEEARRSVPGQPARSTFWRWWRIGVNGIRLETVVIGGKRFTSAEALKRFADALTAASDPSSTANAAVEAPPERDPSTVRRLEEAGLI